MKQDKFLIGILAGIGLLVLVSLGLFFARQGEQVYLAEDTPEGVVHNYVLALQEEDFSRAYGYLAEDKDKPSIAEFRQAFSFGRMDTKDLGVQIRGTEILEDEENAFVDLVIIQSANGLFSEVYRREEAGHLVLQSGEWKITRMPYDFWDFSWYENFESRPIPLKIEG